MSQVEIRHTFSASPERVFEALSDHAGMGAWLPLPVRVPVPTPGGGVGTVRSIQAGPLRIDEEVLEHDPPRRIVYTICNRVPGIRAHRGEIDVQPAIRGGSEVRWRVRVDSLLPGFAAVVTRSLKVALGRGLAKLDRRLR